MNSTYAEAQKQAFNPCSLPDEFTVYNFAPEEIRSFLHPHWRTQKAPHPMLYYFFGLLYLFIGTAFVYPSVSHQLNASNHVQYDRNSGYNWQCDGSAHFRALRFAANAGQYADHELGRGRFLAHDQFDSRMRLQLLHRRAMEIRRNGLPDSRLYRYGIKYVEYQLLGSVLTRHVSMTECRCSMWLRPNWNSNVDFVGSLQCYRQSI